MPGICPTTIGCIGERKEVHGDTYIIGDTNELCYNPYPDPTPIFSPQYRESVPQLSGTLVGKKEVHGETYIIGDTDK